MNNFKKLSLFYYYIIINTTMTLFSCTPNVMYDDPNAQKVLDPRLNALEELRWHVGNTPLHTMV